MRNKIHIPTEQFGFIEVEVEGTEQEVVEQYLKLKNAWVNRNLTSEEVDDRMKAHTRKIDEARIKVLKDEIEVNKRFPEDNAQKIKDNQVIIKFLKGQN